MDIKKIEAEILSVIPYYTPRMDTRELDNLIDSAEQLKLDKLKIHLYEQKQEFGRCIMIYLESDHVKKTDVFQWLFNLSKKKDKKKESDMIKDAITGLRKVSELYSDINVEHENFQYEAKSFVTKDSHQVAVNGSIKQEIENIQTLAE